MVDVEVVVGFGWELCDDFGILLFGDVLGNDVVDEIVGSGCGCGGSCGGFG